MKRFFLLGFILLTACTSVQTPAFPSCAVIQEFEVRGDSMVPLLNPGQNISVDMNHSCFNLSRGDIVLYNFAGNDAPVVKQIMAVPGDSWSLNGTDIIVNDEILVNSEGILYRTNAKARKMLSLYVEDYPIIEPKTYLILGNDPSGSLDASRFGLVHEKDMVGKVVEIRPSE